MKGVNSQILRSLSLLKGLPLSIARRAGNMLFLYFGRVTASEVGSYGEFALHIQCAWRIEGSEGIFTGRSDLWEPIPTAAGPVGNEWDYETDGNLLDQRMNTLLGGYDQRTRSSVNVSGHLTVIEIESDDFGGISVSLSGGYRLVVFPDGSKGENWQFLQFLVGEHLAVVGETVAEVRTDRGVTH